MKKSLIYVGLFLVLSTLVLVVHWRKDDFKERNGKWTPDIEEIGIDQRAEPSGHVTAVIAEEQDTGKPGKPGKEGVYETHEAPVQQDTAGTVAEETGTGARFKRHLARLFGLDPRPPQDGPSGINPVPRIHTGDGQGGDLLSKSRERTAIAGAKTSADSDAKDGGGYAERGLAYVGRQKKDPDGLLPKGDASQTASVNGRVGYVFDERLALEVDLDYIAGLPGYDLAINFDALTSPDQTDLDVTTYTPTVKYLPDLGSKTAKPYIIGGFGLMRAESASGKWSPFRVFDPNHESELELSSKVGLGLELRKNNTSLGVQGSLISGYGDLADVAYHTWSMGLTLHW